jgi:hypothetical protein
MMVMTVTVGVGVAMLMGMTVVMVVMMVVGENLPILPCKRSQDPNPAFFTSASASSAHKPCFNNWF